ncbi:MAG: transposase [Bacteroidales bacterium]|nr:transposase [Bacteroidales bacterium]
MKKSLRYKTLESEYVVSQDGKVEAKISKIILRKVGKNEKVEVEHNARLVEYWTIDKYGKKKYARLVTNDLESDFHKIIDIYDHRWQIELLFKQLKQNFQLRYFYGDSVNAIETQIWVTLIANLLMTVVQKQLKNRYPNRQFCFSNIICLTRNMLMYYIDMYKLIYNPEKEWNAVNQKHFDTQIKIQF